MAPSGEALADYECSEDERRGFSEPSPENRRTNRKELLREVFWPRDLLPRVFPQARITTWGYGVQIEKIFASASQATIFYHAQTLLSDLAMLRGSEPDRTKPLVFIAHSLGGIIVKDALSLSQNDLTHLKDILPATIGVMFLGTPHHGSKAASLGKVAFEISRVFFQNPNMDILRGLERNSEILERITRSFGQILAAGHLRVHSFREELDTKGMSIVDASSYSIGYLYETKGSLYANHRNMAKISSFNDINFQRVTSVIQRWLDESGDPHTRAGIPENASSLPDELTFDKEYRRCLESLNFAIARRRTEDVAEAFGETYEWIFDPKFGFQDWLKGEDIRTKYWIQGKPGSGKSTLMKFAKDHPLTRNLLQQYHPSHWVVAAYFFHDRGTEVQKSISGFLREILYQILRQRRSLFPLIYPLFRLNRPSSSIRGIGLEGGKEDILKQNDDQISDNWSPSVLQDALLSIACKSVVDVNICIFVDALDEHDGNHRDLLSTLDRLTRMTSNNFFRLRLCLAGRQQNIFKDAFRDCPGFSIHDHTTGDIRRYTERRIQDAMSGKLTRDSELALSSLIEDIIDKAEGVFLWVKLVNDELVEGLCEGDSIEELRDLLSGIPNELKDLYTRALRRPNRTQTRAPAKSKYERYVMFQIVKCCREPFSLYELLSATLFLTTGRGMHPELQKLSRDQMERRLYSRSAGLLDATGRYMDGEYLGSPVVQFIHQTVKEYMTTGEGSTIIVQDIKIEPQDNGFMFILRYLVYLLVTFDESDRYIDAGRFAARSFAHYARKVEWHGNQSVSKVLGPAISRLTNVQQCFILKDVINQMAMPVSLEVLNSMRNRPEARLLVFYIGSCLHKSFADSLREFDNQITQGDRVHLLRIAIYMLESEHLPIERASTDRISKSSILEDLLRAELGNPVFRSSSERFDEDIQWLISKCYIEPAARRESVSQLWTRICAPDRDQSGSTRG